VAAHGVVRSDPVVFPVRFRDELSVSFEVDGAVAGGGTAAFPESSGGTGSYARRRPASASRSACWWA